MHSLATATTIFDSIIKSGSGFEFETFLLIAVIGVALGFLISMTYLYIKRKVGYGSDFPLTVFIIPVIVALIIYFVRDNIAGGLTLGGIFALTRFRSEQKDTEDLTYIFLAMAAGLITGLGYVLPASIATIMVLIILMVLHFTKFGIPSSNAMNLKIIVPEDINFENLFDDLLDSHCSSWTLSKVRSTDFGTMFELSYRINIKKETNRKELLDEIRVRNGNLNITLVTRR